MRIIGMSGRHDSCGTVTVILSEHVAVVGRAAREELGRCTHGTSMIPTTASAVSNGWGKINTVQYHIRYQTLCSCTLADDRIVNGVWGADKEMAREREK